MRLCLFSQLCCFLWIEKQTFKNEFVIWKDSCDQVSLNRIQDVIFELHYPYQRERQRQRGKSRQKWRRKQVTAQEGGVCDLMLTVHNELYDFE